MGQKLYMDWYFLKTNLVTMSWKFVCAPKYNGSLQVFNFQIENKAYFL